MAAPSGQRQLTVSYILWIAGFMSPFAGLHRLYNGKIGSGLLWLCTWGLFGVGQFIDVFFVPGMAEEQQFKLRAKYGYSPFGPLDPQPQPTVTVPETPEQKMAKLLRAAAKHGGQLSVTKAVMETELGFEETETLLRDMVKRGYVAVSNHPSTGVVVYHFDELTV
ncbi:TM2 domain-containing protein [Leptolyngbya sp. PCC 6406]|uniref:TM2 domain-containing protein n=1 Tax=Leptolyngbya sp. PCC 6406 TaxID=1173264 RepID=UPI0002ACBEB1|nr:TM2 domain-containing protein [Leptolyngbya sp. PCC 6406]